MRSAIYVLIVTLSFIFQCVNGYGLSQHLRKLVGSNCVQIERGIITPYYECVGCVVERATECLTDLRLNKSGNVRFGCPMSSAFMKFPGEICCPTFEPLLNDLEYMGAGYPMALKCMRDAGCETSLIYSQLLTECEKMCPGLDPRSSSTACLADFNGATSILSVRTATTVVASIVLGVLLPMLW